MGYAGNVGVSGHCHYACTLSPFLVKSIELVPGALEQFRRPVVLDQVDGDVVQLYRVGDGHQATLLYLHVVRLVVVTPVANVLDALLGQDVRGVEGLRQSRPHPAPGRRAGELPDGVNSAADYGPLVRL